MHHSKRREFLKSSAALVAGVSMFGMPGFIRAGANGRIRVAVVGLGGRGQNHVQAIHALATENVDLAALRDCDEMNLNRSAAAYEKLSGRRATPFGDLRKVLDDRSIDAVTFATPNHWHSLAAIWACQAGKDVYVEKPGSHNIFEGRKMVETAHNCRRILQHGTQCRSSPNIAEGVQKLREGVIGKVYLVRAVIYKILRGHRPAYHAAGTQGVELGCVAGTGARAAVLPDTATRLALPLGLRQRATRQPRRASNGPDPLGAWARHAPNAHPVDGRPLHTRRRSTDARHADMLIRICRPRSAGRSRGPQLVHQQRGKSGRALSVRRSPERRRRDLPGARRLYALPRLLQLLHVPRQGQTAGPEQIGPRRADDRYGPFPQFDCLHAEP